jgi:DNA-binding MarR family transcriptional regulator/DNA-binding XRE family transcriptional regulator
MNAAKDAAAHLAHPGAQTDHAGATLRRAREAAGWSQRELAARAGVHQPQVARVERGEDVQSSLLARLGAPLGLVPGLLAMGPGAKAVQPPAPAALHDTVADSFESWRATWPDVNPEVFAILTRLMRAGRHVDDDIEQSAHRLGISKGDVVVLGTLRRGGGPHFEMTPTALKNLLWISLPGLKKRLDRLEERGLIKRSENPHDARGFVVRLTAKGRVAVDDMVRHSPAAMWHTLRETPPADLAQLSDMLRSLLARVEAREAAQGKP